MGLQSKFTVYAAIAGVLALMGGIVYYASLDNVSLEQVEVELADVILREAGENEAKFFVTFLVKNPSEKIFVVPVIAYQLYGDDMLLGSGKYSTEDVALP
jgi:LEA14-like dessication related protein